jgi:hypothetical protein
MQEIDLTSEEIDNFLNLLEILVFLKREMGSLKDVSENNAS